jgi:F0F1-type ATP synthase beta subunit
VHVILKTLLNTVGQKITKQKKIAEDNIKIYKSTKRNKMTMTLDPRVTILKTGVILQVTKL